MKELSSSSGVLNASIAGQPQIEYLGSPEMQGTRYLL